MAITKQKKTETVEELVSAIKEATSVFIVNYEGMKVQLDNGLRKKLNTKGVKYRVAKNTLIKLALKECGVEGLDEYLKGVSAVMLGDSEEPVLPAKELVDFLKENPEKIAVKAINIDGEVIKGDKLADVAKMPGRLELIGTIVSIAMGPAGNLVSVIKGPASTIAGQLKALEEKLEN